jgi:CheY-like chemotaxis protein
VLVLEDDPMVRGAYLNALGASGCRVLSAGTLDEALAHLDHARPDAVVVDCQLAEGASGFEAVRRMRALHAGLPAVMVTADTGQEAVDAAQAQALPLLRKPVDDLSLGRTLAAVMAAATGEAQDEACVPPLSRSRT